MRKVASLVFVSFVFASIASAQTKKRIAVMDFEYGTVRSAVASIFGTDQDVGKGIADLLVEKLVTSGVYSLIERKALDKILAEQNFSNSDRADPASAAKLGKLLGVDAILIGSITQFGRDDSHVSAGGAGSSLGRFGIGGLGKKESKAVVGISARLVNINTGEIQAAVKGMGESKRSGLMLGGGGGGWSGAGGGHLDMGSSNFAATILGEAVNEAVNSAATQLDQKAGSLPTVVVKVSGQVADVSGDTLILTVGSKAGVKVGDRLAVTRAIREIKDPATGAVIRRVEDNLGVVQITEVDEVSSVGKYTGAPAKVGDTVKTQ
jgi:curli biogenesis system outer membrane secretion channel CsgG